MQIVCPACNFSKQVDPTQLPPEATRATCPKCGERFELPPRTAEPAVATAPAEVQPEDSAASAREPAAKTGDRQAEIDALPKAGFWIRVVATLLDGLLVFILQVGLGSLLMMAGMAAGTGEEVGGLVMLLSYLISFAYYIVFTGYCGQTPGKMALRIKVIRTDGSQIGYGKAAFRELVAKFISGIIFGIGYLMVAFDRQKQGLHDRMSDTYVIKL